LFDERFRLFDDFLFFGEDDSEDDAAEEDESLCLRFFFDFNK
jgi:hypothetical protein